MALRAALFDMDGTIWDSPVDWRDVRRAIGLPQDGRPITEHLESMPPDERARGTAILERFEAIGVDQGQPIPGATELLDLLQSRGVLCVLVTNNSRRSAAAVLRRYPLPFDRVVTRNEGPLKPSPEAFLRPLRDLGVSSAEALAIGDSHLDLVSAHSAGIPEIVLVAPKDWIRDLLPRELEFREAKDLFHAAAIVGSLLQPAGRLSKDEASRESS
jgi:HAD superfamily hydrolase (TIGR01549 family)